MLNAAILLMGCGLVVSPTPVRGQGQSPLASGCLRRDVSGLPESPVQHLVPVHGSADEILVVIRQRLFRGSPKGFQRLSRVGEDPFLDTANGVTRLDVAGFESLPEPRVTIDPPSVQASTATIRWVVNTHTATAFRVLPPFYRNPWFVFLGLLSTGAMVGWLLSSARARRHARDVLEASRDQYLDLYEGAPDIHWQCDHRSGTVVECNDRALRSYGYTREQLVGLPIQELWAPSHRHLLPMLMDRLRRDGGVSDMEFVALRVDGSQFPAELNCSAVYDSDGAVVGGRVIVRDVTQRQENEQRLRMFQLIMDQSFEPAFWVREDGSFAYVNEAACRFLHLPAEVLLQGSVMELDPMARDTFSSTWEVLEERGSILFESELREARGEVIPVEIAGTLVESAGERFAGLFVRDLRERRAHQEEQRRLGKRMERAQRLESLSTLTGGFAHEFNNLLMGIVGYAELLGDDLDGGNSGRGYVDGILDASLRAKTLVAQLIDFSGAELGSPEVLNFSDAVRNAVDFVRATLDKHLNVQEHYDARAAVEADRSQLSGLVANLVKNAAHAMENRKGWIRISTEDVVLEHPTEMGGESLARGSYVRLVVQDDGGGMSPDVLERIFEPFFTTREPRSGKGLGLSVVHGVVQSYDGGIQATSEEGVGTRFEVMMPALGESEPQSVSDSGDPADGRRPSVLVVDDQEHVAEVTCLHMTSLGYRATRVDAATTALKQIRDDEAHFDLIISDFSMPGMNGAELAKAVLELEAGIPVILMTGYSAAMSPEDLTAAGISAVLHKPFRRADLKEALEKVSKPKHGATWGQIPAPPTGGHSTR